MSKEVTPVVPPTNSTPEVKAAEPVVTPPAKEGEAAAPAAAPKEKEEKVVEPPKEAAPAVEKYELKLPEGSTLDASAIAATEAFAKEKGLSNEQAQALIDRDNATKIASEAAQAEFLKTTNEVTWKNQLQADPEVGGKDFEANGHLVARAALKFGGQEMVDELKASNLNHQPMLFKLLYRVGKAMADDKLVEPGATVVQKSIEEKLYDNTK